MKMLRLTLISLCLSTVMVNARETNTPPKKMSEEATPPALVLRIDNRMASGDAVVPVELDEEVPLQKWGIKKGARDITFHSSDGKIIEIWGSGNLELPSGLFEDTNRTSLTKLNKSYSRGEDSMILAYNQYSTPSGDRSEIVLLPKSRDSIILAYLNTTGDNPINREILEGFMIRQRVIPNAEPDVEGASANRYWLPVDVVTADGVWKLTGNSTAMITHKGNCYQINVYRSLRRTPGTDLQLPFEGEPFNFSATLYRV